MLTSSFNESAEHHKEVLSHQKEADFNYSMKGDAEDVGRIATNNSQEHKSEAAIRKKKARHSEALRRLLHQQEVMRRLDDIFGKIKQKEKDLKAEEEKLRLAEQELDELETIKANKDLNAAKEKLEAQGIDTENMSDEQAWEAFDQIIDDKNTEIGGIEDNIETIKNDIRKLAKEAHDLIGNELTPEHPKYQEYMDKLNALENRAEALGEDNVINDVNNETNWDYQLLRSKVGGNEDSTQTVSGYDFTVEADEITETYLEVAGTDEIHEPLFPKMEGMLSDEFNVSATGKDALDAAIENSVDENMELMEVSQPIKPLTPS